MHATRAESLGDIALSLDLNGLRLNTFFIDRYICTALVPSDPWLAAPTFVA
jgi:hypothetical protein